MKKNKQALEELKGSLDKILEENNSLDDFSNRLGSAPDWSTLDPEGALLSMVLREDTRNSNTRLAESAMLLLLERGTPVKAGHLIKFLTEGLYEEQYKLLLEQFMVQADPNHQPSVLVDCLNVCVFSLKADLMEITLDQVHKVGANIPENKIVDWTQVITQAYTDTHIGDTVKAMELLKPLPGFDVDARDQHGSTLLMNSKYGPLTRWLLTNGARMDLLNKEGQPPLVMAWRSNADGEATSLLLAHGADIDNAPSLEYLQQPNTRIDRGVQEVLLAARRKQALTRISNQTTPLRTTNKIKF